MPKEKITQELRMSVWDRHISLTRGEYLCLVCEKNIITQTNFDCGHIIAEAHGGKTTIENLKPICTECNKKMSTMHMDDYKDMINGISNDMETDDTTKSMRSVFKKKGLKKKIWTYHVPTGLGTILCFCCKEKTINQIDMKCGYKISPEEYGTNDFSNIVPICTSCSRILSRSKKNMDNPIIRTKITAKRKHYEVDPMDIC